MNFNTISTKRQQKRQKQQYKLMIIKQKNQVLDPMEVLEHLYEIDNTISVLLLKNCRINPDLRPKNQIRNDLEFYIPQLVNYMLFFKALENEQLNEFILGLVEMDLYFGHLLYWNFNSNQKIIRNQSEESLPQVQDIIEVILKMANKKYKDKLCISLDQISKIFHFLNKNDLTNQQQIQSYIAQSPYIHIVQFYKPIYNHNQDKNPFLSTINFFDDLIQISELLSTLKKKSQSQKLLFLQEQLKLLNQSLPANVYIPFFRKSLRNYVVLNIVVQESIVFNTKERVPFYICIEVFRPEENLKLIDNIEEKKTFKQKIEFKLDSLLNSLKHEISPYKQNLKQFDEILSKPLTYNLCTDFKEILFNQEKQEFQEKQNIIVKQSQNLIEQDSIIIDQQQQLQPHQIQQGILLYEYQYDEQMQNSDNQLNINNNQQVQYISDFPQSDIEIRIEEDQLVREQRQLQIKELIFSNNSIMQKMKIKNSSEYGEYNSWELIHLIIKTGDNFKQEQLASQLVYQFEQIFKVEKLQLFLYPYEVVSLNPTSGIIEMVKDAVTIDSLKQKLYQEFKRNVTLKDYFNYFYPKKKELKDAKKNFCRSLAAYSLLCYLLQVKDRHNGNILLDQQGHIIHIDFGFFISNAPGQGFEQNIPFKFNQEYLDVLDGPNSKLFQYFRKLFFKGFKALKKHQDKILVLIKMMYVGHGSALPCFKAGDKCIDSLYNRFNPKIEDKDDGAINIFTQNLINQALNNHRTHWYDKFQYYFQGIFY